LVIRDKRVYVPGTPEVPDGPVRVYQDVLGVPDEGVGYLIGMVVFRTAGTEERFSYRGEAREQERDPFEQFLTEVDRYEDFRVYCYGGSGRAFLGRTRKAARRKGPGTG
jgi:hypothetical protein